jgi:hypothetical protein
MEKARKVYKVLVGKPKARRPFKRPRCRWEDGIGMDLREIGCGGGVDSDGSQKGLVVGSYEHGDDLQVLVPLS